MCCIFAGMIKFCFCVSSLLLFCGRRKWGALQHSLISLFLSLYYTPCSESVASLGLSPEISQFVFVLFCVVLPGNRKWSFPWIGSGTFTNLFCRPNRQSILLHLDLDWLWKFSTIPPIFSSIWIGSFIFYFWLFLQRSMFYSAGRHLST